MKMDLKTKNVIDWVAIVTCGIIALVTVSYVTHYRFANPDLTETELAIDLWPFTLLLLGAGIVLSVVRRYTKP
jgi:cytochrome c-type biogenesis protein CcmH/NrfF